jgi:hypothetical protein
MERALLIQVDERGCSEQEIVTLEEEERKESRKERGRRRRGADELESPAARAKQAAASAVSALNSKFLVAWPGGPHAGTFGKHRRTTRRRVLSRLTSIASDLLLVELTP